MAPARRNASDIWNYMSKTSPGIVTCNTCGSTFNYIAGGTTSNLRRHIAVKHMKVPEPIPMNKNTESHENLQPRPPVMTQPSVRSALARVNKYETGSTKKTALDDLLLGMIVKDLQPFSVVEDQGFRDFVEGLDPRYELPSRRTITRDLLPRKFKTEEDELKTVLREARHVAITTDLWTSRQTESYITVTAHFLAPHTSWKLQAAVLATQKVAVDHTAANIAVLLKDLFEQWDIEEKISSIVTDNASTMVSLVNDHMKKHHVRCFAHSLNLIVRDGLKNSGDLLIVIGKVKAIVSFFHHSVKAAEKLRSFQSTLGLPQKKLIQDVETRWNSTLKMLSRYADEHTAVTGALCSMGRTSMSVTDSEVDTIRSAIEVLSPFELATEEASTEKHTSLSKMLPTVRQIMEKLSQEPQSPLRDQLQLELRRRFSCLEGNFTLGAATLLDPRFKRLPFADPSSATKVEDRLINMMTRSEPSEQTVLAQTPLDSEAEEREEPPRKKSLWDTFDRKVENLKKTTVPNLTGPYVEMRRYHEVAHLSRTEDPFLWWEENQSNFPRLSILARKYLHIPATSVPAERLFSKAGELISARRSCLKASTVNMVLFLNKKKK
ncbi:zinc finger BED domain-containing protein 1-like [Aplysia californica]|uniref:Zinc finger BED domain-containing protein 1-like n=1 Tax=Aplysia californica TaxID=6500 RepID=A0ABM0KBJ4_APLCA|nr:zinc finger BED domain-containing protein 1-like [Aplysia californica]